MNDRPKLGMLIMVHRAFERDISRLIVALSADMQQQEKINALWKSWELFHKLLEHHHQAEDLALWPVLLKSFPASSEVILRMTAQHHQLDVLLGKSFSDMVAWRDGPSAETAKTALDGLHEIKRLLEAHLAEEEAGALPLVGAHLTQEQWAGFTSHNMELNQGLTWTFPWLAEGQPDEVRTMLWSVLPKEVLDGPAQLWCDSYAKLIEEAFDLKESKITPPPI